MNLDLLSYYRFSTTSAFSLCFLSSSASVDSNRLPFGPPNLGAWFARANECFPLANTWRLRHPLISPRLCYWRIVVVCIVLNRREVVQCWRVVYMRRHCPLLPDPCCIVVVFPLLCLWAFCFLHLLCVTKVFGSFWLFYPLFITFIGGSCSWHPCKKLIGPRNHVLLPRILQFFKYLFLGCPVLICCNFFFLLFVVVFHV